MSRQREEPRIQTVAERAALPSRRKPYFISLHNVRGAHLGYRKIRKNDPPTGGGSWLLRYRLDGKYREVAFGQSDDRDLPANDHAIFTFDQAVNRAVQIYSGRTTAAALDAYEREAEAYTVGKCMSDYLDWLESESRPIDDPLWRIRTHIEPDLKDIPCAELTPQILREWRDSLAELPPRVRRPAVCRSPSYRAVDMEDPEVKRKRRATVNRTLTVLRAALNHAFEADILSSDIAWRKVRGFKGVEARPIRFLQADEVRRLLNACEPEFRQLVRGALLTGCRYGELQRVIVNDFERAAEMLFIKHASGDRSRHVILTEQGVAFFEQLCAGRLGGEQVFVRSDGKPWGPSQQNRRIRLACERAKIDPPVNFHGLRHTYAAQLVSSGVPLLVVADNLGHRDTRMCEKHYAHLTSNYRKRMIQERAPELVGGDDRAALKNVVWIS